MDSFLALTDKVLAGFARIPALHHLSGLIGYNSKHHALIRFNAQHCFLNRFRNLSTMMMRRRGECYE